jgi:hypothetical protein
MKKSVMTTLMGAVLFGAGVAGAQAPAPAASPPAAPVRAVKPPPAAPARAVKLVEPVEDGSAASDPADDEDTGESVPASLAKGARSATGDAPAPSAAPSPQTTPSLDPAIPMMSLGGAGALTEMLQTSPRLAKATRIHITKVAGGVSVSYLSEDPKIVQRLHKIVDGLRMIREASSE